MDAQVLEFLKEIKNDISQINQRLDKLEHNQTLSDAFPQNEEIQKLIKKEFTELRKWVKIEVSDRLYKNMDNNDGMILKKLGIIGNNLKDILITLDSKLNSVASQVNIVEHIVDAMPRGMS